MQVVAAGRHPDAGRDGLADLNLQHARLDHSARDFPAALARLARSSDPLRRAVSSRRTTASRSPRCGRRALTSTRRRPAIRDALSDKLGPFPAARRGAARRHLGRAALPALSSAVIDSQFRAPCRRSTRSRSRSRRRSARSPGEGDGRGRARLRRTAFKWRSNGAWRDAWGWQELKRLRFYAWGALGRRLRRSGLELFPSAIRA